VGGGTRGARLGCSWTSHRVEPVALGRVDASVQDAAEIARAVMKARAGDGEPGV
jgi:hypothetical protein